MKECPIHFEEYDDTEGNCPLCELTQPSAPPDAPELDDTPDGDTPKAPDAPQTPRPRNAGKPADSESLDAMIAKNSDSLSKLLEQVRRIQKDGDTGRTNAPPPQDRETASAPQLPVATAADFRAREDEPETTISLQALMAELQEFKRLKVPVIVIVGLRQTGKTWFLHTLVQALREAGIQSPDGWMRAGQIGATRSIGLRRFKGEVKKGAKPVNFVVVDVPGEQLSNLLSRSWEATRALIAAMDTAASIILALPADHVAFSDLVYRGMGKGQPAAWLARQLNAIGITKYSADDIAQLAARHVELEAAIGYFFQNEQDCVSALPEECQIYLAHKRFVELRDAHTRIDELGANLAFVASLLSFLKFKKLGADAIGTDEITETQIKNHFLASEEFRPVGGLDGKDCPLFVALTKGDTLLSLISPGHTEYHALSHSLRQQVDNRILANLMSEDVRDHLYALVDDPRRILRKCKPRILADINACFRLNKIDFVTTHYGYDGGNTLEVDSNAERQFGIEAVILWIHWARSEKRKKGWKYHSTELARVMRNHVEKPYTFPKYD